MIRARKWLKFSQHHHHLQNPLILGEDHCLLYHLLLLLGYLLDNLSFHIRLGEVLYPTIFQFVCNYSQKVLEFDFRPHPSCIQTLPYTFDGPKWQMESGLIGSQPGVSRNSKIMLENGKTKNKKNKNANKMESGLIGSQPGVRFVDFDFWVGGCLHIFFFSEKKSFRFYFLKKKRFIGFL